MPPPHRRFGKYVLLDLLATGGMAEVYRAKLSGAESFERLLAIKCIRPEYASDEEFASMFVAEARIAGQLNHPNIVQIFELGKFETQLYIAMELVEGRDVHDIIRKAEQKGERIPVAFAAHVIRHAALGLDFAHRILDPDGNPLGLVHRDVSPRNILVSWQGAVKVVDFGIAKAVEAEGPRTRVGVLKGKFNYLAPEQVVGTKLDRRADIFNLGNCLYEILSGRKLYTGTSEFEILNQARDGKLPDYRAALPDAPRDLITVLETATAPNRQDRYAWASDMAKAMDPLLIEDRSIFGAAEAAAFLERLYAEERERDLSRIRAAMEALVEADAVDDDFGSKTQTFMSAFSPAAPKLPRAPTAVTVAGGLPVGPGGSPFTMPPGEPSLPPQPEPAPAMSPVTVAVGGSGAPFANQTPTAILRASRSRALLPIFGGGLLLGALIGWLGWPATEPAPQAAAAQPASARPAARPPAVADPSVDEVEEEAEDELAAEEEAQARVGYLRISLRRSKGVRVFVDDKPIRSVAKPIPVPVGKHVVRVERKGKKRDRQVVVTEKHTPQAPLRVNLAP